MYKPEPLDDQEIINLIKRGVTPLVIEHAYTTRTSRDLPRQFEGLKRPVFTQLRERRGVEYSRI